MTLVPTDEQLRSRIEELERELAMRVEEAEEKELQLQRYAADLRETFMQERTRSAELRRSYMLTVRALASAVEARDAYTGRHAERVAAYGMALADVYGMSLADEPQIEFGFLLHDAGKVAVPDAILFKPGPLTAAERLVMQQHPVTGSEIVREIDFLGAARDVIRSHHERWDGSGYPDGLSGEHIPVSARVFAVADTLDALTTRRPYRDASSLADARGIIEAGRGSHFDPDVIVAFRALPDADIEAIRRRIGG
jgi:ribonuclease P protein subunit RPR2